MRRVIFKFFADRGPHLAAMIAYFALLSFVPLLFLALSLLGLAGRFDESSFLIHELERAFPGTSLNTILNAVRSIQRNSATLGIVGGAVLLWSSLSLFSVLESAFNIVYGRPNRRFLHGKALATVMLVGMLVTLFASLLTGSLGVEFLQRYAGGVIGNSYVAYALSVAVSLAGVFLFVVAAYYLLTNVRLEVRDVLPGAIFAAIVLEASFQAIPVYLRLVRHLPAQAIGGPGDPARLALRDGERDRARRRDQLGRAAPSVVRRRHDPSAGRCPRAAADGFSGHDNHARIHAREPRDRARRPAAADRRGRLGARRRARRARPLRLHQGQDRPRHPRAAARAPRRAPRLRDRDHPDPRRRGQDDDRDRADRGARHARQPRGALPARALPRPRLRDQGRRRGRRLRPGGADGGAEPPLHRRHPRDRRGQQPARGDARRAPAARQRARRRPADDHLAAVPRHERPRACGTS